MTLWFGVALMTAAAVWAVLWPLARRGSDLGGGSDVAVYRDQLAEIERDRAAGLIAENEAAGAQVEVSRRLIAAADAQAPPPADAVSAKQHFMSHSAPPRCRISRLRRGLPVRAAIRRSTR